MGEKRLKQVAPRWRIKCQRIGALGLAELCQQVADSRLPGLHLYRAAIRAAMLYRLAFAP